MKNQYVGDVGDYGKYGLLRFLSENDIVIGVNWYLTPDDGGNDGKHISYLKRGNDRKYDEKLFDFLGKIATSEEKSVRMIEDGNIIPNALFYHEIVDRINRDRWHGNGLKALKSAELIFCDPDNGPIGKKSLLSKEADKYVAPMEIADYYNRGQNVVYYCQRARRTDTEWMKTKTEMQRFLPDAQIYVLTYHRGTQRAYIFVLHPEDYGRYADILYAFEQTSWGQKGIFTREPVCGLES